MKLKLQKELKRSSESSVVCVECHHGIGFNIVGLKTFIYSCLSFLGIKLAFWGMTYLKYSYQAIVIKFPMFIFIYTRSLTWIVRISTPIQISQEFLFVI